MNPDALRSFVESKAFERFVISIIILNAITLGFETSKTVMATFGPVLLAIDRLVLWFFVVELVMKFIVYRLDFFKSPWRIFDFIIVAIALMPTTGAFSVLRALRILRVLRLVSVVPSMRRVIGGLLAALPGMGSIVLLLGLVFYVFSVMATKLFGSGIGACEAYSGRCEEFVQWFGTLGGSAYSLFQIMTLESWSMGIVRPVMEVFPWAWAFFIPFILCTTFTVLNLFIGVVVSAMQAEHDEAADDARQSLREEQTAILQELRALRKEVAAMRSEGRAGT
ncbi:MAG: ion transporter [Pseudomonadota bacterium]